MRRWTCTVTLMLAIAQLTSAPDVPEYRTKYVQPPSPDWYLPIRQFLTIFYDDSTSAKIWNYLEGDGKSQSRNFGEIVGSFRELLAFGIVAVYLAAAALIAFLCFLCCRCYCGQCGGTYRQSLKTCDDRRRLIILSALLAATLTITLVPLGYVFSSLPMKHDIVSSYVHSLDDNLIDFEIYTNHSRLQIDDLIVTEIVDTLDEQSTKIQNFSNIIGQQIKDYVEEHSAVRAVLANLSIAGHAIDGLQLLLGGLANDTQAANTDVDSLNDLLQSLSVDLQAFIVVCEKVCNFTNGANCSMANCDAVSSITAKESKLNFTTLNINLTDPLQHLQNVVADNFSETIAKFRSSFDDIASIVRNASQDTTNDIAHMLKKTGRFVVNSTQEMNSFFEKGVEAVEKIRKSFRRDMDTDQNEMGDDSVFGYSLAISVILAVVWVLFTSGLFGGLLAFDRKRPPTERSGLSDFFGTLLLISAYLTLAISVVFWLVVAALSVLGVGMDVLICRPLFDDSLHLLDKLENESNIPSSFGNSNFLISTVLHSCEKNRSALQSFDIALDFNETLQVDLNNFTTRWTLTNISEWNLDLYPDTFEGDLADLHQAVTINLTHYLNEINAEMERFSKINETLESLVTTLEVEFEYATDLERNVRNLTNIVQRLLSLSVEFQNQLVDLQSRFAVWDTKATITTDQVTDSLSALPDITHAMTEGASQVVIDYGNGFINTMHEAVSELIYSLYNNVGNCGQLWVIFQSFRMTSCRIIVDTVNAFWICLALVLLLFTVAIVPAVKLSKYFRIMHKPSQKDERFQRSNIARQPKKNVNHAKNSYFNAADEDDVDNFYLRPSSTDQGVSTISSSVMDPRIPVPQPRTTRIQPIIMAFEKHGSTIQPQPDQRQLPLPDLVTGDQPAIRLSPDQFELYKRIPRVATSLPPPPPSSVSSSSSAWWSPAYETLSRPPPTENSVQVQQPNQPLYFEPIPSPIEKKSNFPRFRSPATDRRYE